MARYEITAPDGSRYEITAPDNASEADVMAYAQSQWTPPSAAPSSPAEPERNRLKETALGALTGAAGVGNVLLTPVRAAVQAAAPQSGLAQYMERMQQEPKALESEYQDSNYFGGGKLGAQMAATLPVGGALGGVARAIPGAARVAPNLIRAVETSGLTGGNLATRAAGGAISGAAQAALVEPESAGTGAAIGAAFPILGAAGGALGSKLASRAPVDPQRLAAAQAAQKAGYVIPPSDIRPQGMFTEAIGGLSGKIKTAQVASERNQNVTTNLIKRELGVPEDAPLNRDVLLSIRKAAGDAYRNVRGIGTVTADTDYFKALDGIKAQYEGAARSFPGLKRNDISELVESLKRPEFDAGDAVDAISILRDQSDSMFAKGEKGAAKAYREASAALENALDRQVVTTGNPDLITNFRNARQTIAKTYTVEKALNPETGEVSAQALAALYKRGKPLTGGILTAAKTGTAFPKATQALKESPKAISPLDWAVGALSGTATGNPLAIGALAARPAARAALLSGPVQRRAAQMPTQFLPPYLSGGTSQLGYRLATPLGLLAYDQ